MIRLRRQPYTPKVSVTAGESESGPVPCQVIGISSRLSGIVLSRTAYMTVLESLLPVVQNPLGTARLTRAEIHLFACAMSLNALEHISLQPGRRVWCLVLESTVLRPEVLATITRIEQVWVPTQFCFDICVANGVDPAKLRLVPYYLPLPERARKLPEVNAPFTVLASWDAKSSINRKNVLGMIEVFQRAFPHDPRVRLRLKTRDLDEQHKRLIYDSCGRDPRIQIWDETVPSPDDIYDGAHVLLHLHRSEGFGRHIVEAQLRRLPVIATGYSGCMDWLTPANAFLVEYDLVDTAQREFQYPQGGRWAQPRLESGVEALRKCRLQYGELAPMLDRAQKDASTMVSFDRSRKAMLDALVDLNLGPHIKNALLHSNPA